MVDVKTHRQSRVYQVKIDFIIGCIAVADYEQFIYFGAHV